MDEFSDSINAEIVEEEEKTPAPEPEKSLEVLPPPKKKKLSLKHKLIAEYAARCYPIDTIAQIVHLKPNTVRLLLEQSEELWEEIDQVIKELFSEGDRVLANLRVSALKRLDDFVSDTNKDVSLAAIEKVLKCYDYSKGQGPQQAILNFYGKGGKSEMGIESIDEFILRRRKERGLLEHKPEEEKEEEE